MLKIVVMAALPQEYAYFGKAAGRWVLLQTKPFKKLSCPLPDKEILLIETGMGAGFAADALMSVMSYGPDLLISCGFAGGLHPDLAVGAICAPQKTFMFDPVGGKHEGKIYTFRFPEDLNTWFAAKSILPVTALTVSAPPDKRLLSSFTGGEPAIVDMETAELVRIASREGVPILCLRSVSDSLSDELGFNIAEITGKGGKVDAFKVLKTIACNPSVARAFYRSWLRSRMAGRNLGAVLADFTRIPAEDLRGMAGGLWRPRFGT